MKNVILLILLIVSSASIVRANQVDPRFDGTWVAIEVFYPSYGPFDWVGAIPQERAVIAISNSGQNLRVVSGFVPGAYWISPKSGGNTLVFYGSNQIEGRKECRLELSKDGNTLKESGFVLFHIKPVVDAQHNIIASTVSVPVVATFHRAGK